MASLSRLGGPALALLLPDLRVMPGPVYTALARSITALVLDGRVATETRLPSERDLAAALHLSRATVTAAYDSLRADGFLASRTGSGSYVTVPAGSAPRPTLSRWSGALHAGPDVLDLSCGAMPGPPGLVQDALATVANRLGSYLGSDGYEPAGLTVLREALAARFTARGVPTRPDQLLVTNGALHAFDLLLRLLLGPGERVVTELPTYPGALDAVRAHGGRVVPVPLAAEGGWQVDALRAALRQTSPRLAYLTPDFHNPTGALVPEDARRAVLSEARRTGTTVVVDESFVELDLRDQPGGVTAAAALDPSVVTLGSLSKPVWGGLRIGWLRAAPELIGRLAALRATIDMGGAVLDQLVGADVVGRLDELADWRRAQVRPQRDALLAALRRELPQWRAVVPDGGLSLWVELDAALSTPLAMLAGQAGVILVPGGRFGVDGTLERFVRLPFALPAERLDEAVGRLAAVWAQLEGTSLPGGGFADRPLVVA